MRLVETTLAGVRFLVNARNGIADIDLTAIGERPVGAGAESILHKKDARAICRWVRDFIRQKRSRTPGDWNMKKVRALTSCTYVKLGKYQIPIDEIPTETVIPTGQGELVATH